MCGLSWSPRWRACGGAWAAGSGWPPQRLAFTENVTSGCVLPLWGLPWQPGDVLLLSDCEHPGVVAACQELARRQQLTIERFRVADLRRDPASTDAAVLERLENALGPRTRLVVLSHLLWNTGQTMPIAAVASRLGQHPQRPWLLVDAAQSLGSIPVAEAARAADIYACTGHKWCCGPEGLGVVALSERLLAEAQPTLIGWRSLSHEGSATSGFHTDARRFEVATSCIPLFAGLDRSLELLEAEGTASPAAMEDPGAGRVPGAATAAAARRTERCCTTPPAGLVSFMMAGIEPAEVVRKLGQRRLWIRSLDDPHCLRACTHISHHEKQGRRPGW